jgi:hypothetical protein
MADLAILLEIQLQVNLESVFKIQEFPFPKEVRASAKSEEMHISKH